MMSNKRLRGITIQINGDTTGLDKSLENVTKQARKTQGELADINKLLRFDPNNTVLIAQKMQVLGEAINNTQNKLSALRQAQVQVEQQFASGQIGAEQYRAFMREITDTETSLANYRKNLKSVQDEQQNLGKATQQMQRFFQATSQDIDDFADVLGTDLVNAIKSGRATSAQLEQAFDKMGQASLGANADLERLRTSLRSMDSGASLDDVRRDLREIEAEAEEAEEAVDKLGEGFAALGGIVSAVAIGKIIEDALQVSDLNAKIDIGFDVPESSKAVVRDSLASVKKYGIDGQEALEGMRRQWALNKDASDESNAAIVEGAAAVAGAYSGIDFIELVQETNEIGKQLKITDAEALNLVNSLLQIGFPQEQLDVIAEYGGQLKRAGFEAREIQGIMAAAVNTNSWNIDNLLDGLKEGRIRAVEMGMGISDSMKENVKLALGDVKAASDETVEAMSTAFSKQEDALSKSLDNRYNEITKSHDKQKTALDKSLEKELESAQKSYSKAEEAKSKSLEKQYEEVAKSYEKQKDELDKALEAELKAFEKASDEKIALIDKEYTEKLKLIDEDKYNQIKAIEAQIEGINSIQDAEDKLQQDKENADKRAELQSKIRQSKDAKSRQDASKALRDFDEKLRLQKVKDERKDQIESLKSEKDLINDAFSEKKDALKEEFEERKDQAKTAEQLEKEALKERQNSEKKALQESNAEKLKLLKESQNEEIKAFKEVNSERLKSLREEHSLRKSALSERLSAEATAIKEAHTAELASFKEMNDQKLDLAKNPPDSGAYQAIEAQLENWGKAIAKGDANSARAFEEMVGWLDSIEDATLRNALGTEMFGGMWEDQGEHIIDSVLGAEEALEQLGDTTDSVKNLMAREEDGNALNSFRQSVEDLKKALEPLMLKLAAVIDVIASFISKHPEIAAIFITISTVVGLAIAAFAALAPAIGAIPVIIGMIGPAIAWLSTAFATITGVVLPALGAAFAFITGPIGLAIIAITAIIGIAILVKKNWEPIAEFFIDLWENIKIIFSAFTDWLTDVFLKFTPLGMIISNWDEIKTYFGELWNKIKDVFSDFWTWLKDVFFNYHPLGLLAKNWDKIKKYFTDLWKEVEKVFKNAGTWLSTAAGEMAEMIMKPINTLKESILDAFRYVKNKIGGIWEGIVNVVKTPLNMLIEMLNSLITGLNKIKAPDWIPVIGGKSVDIPEIPMLAKGTDYFRGGPAIVGEKGPELVTMPTGAKVHPNDKTEDMFGGGNQTFEFTIPIKVDGRVIAQASAKYTNRELYTLSQNQKRGGRKT